MAFEPAPLTANANLQLELDVEPKFKDSCKCFCCIPIRAVIKALTPRRKTLSSVEIRTEVIKTEFLENIDD